LLLHFLHFHHPWWSHSLHNQYATAPYLNPVIRGEIKLASRSLTWSAATLNLPDGLCHRAIFAKPGLSGFARPRILLTEQQKLQD
jgi:hypothetical protein